MSKFIYKDTLQTKYNEGTILTDDVNCKTLEVNKITSNNSFINIDKDINIIGDLSVSGDINIDNIDTIKTNTITSDNNSININKTINTNDINNTGTINSTSDIKTTNIKLDNTNKKIKIKNNDNWDNYVCDGQGSLIGKSDNNKGEIFNDYSNNIASGQYSHAEGYMTEASGDYSHAEGSNVGGSVMSKNIASGLSSHVEGGGNVASGEYSHAEGYGNTAALNEAHVEGCYCKALGQFTHCEGRGKRSGDSISYNIAYSDGSHAEGNLTKTYGLYSHAEGIETITGTINENSTNANVSSGAHAEGYKTQAVGNYSHAEGDNTQALHISSHSGGSNTITGSDYQYVIGKYNLIDNNSLFIVGNGTNNNNRKNAFIVDKDDNTKAENIISRNDVVVPHLYISPTPNSNEYPRWNRSYGRITAQSNLIEIRTSNGTADNYNYNGKIKGPSYETSNYITSLNGNNGIRLNGSLKTIETTTDGGTNWTNYSMNSYFYTGTGRSQFLTYSSGISSINTEDTRPISNDNFSYYIINDIININTPLKTGDPFVSAYRSSSDLNNNFIDKYILNIDLKDIIDILNAHFNASTYSLSYCYPHQNNYIKIENMPDLIYDIQIKDTGHYTTMYSTGLIIIIEDLNASGNSGRGSISGDYGTFFIPNFAGFAPQQFLSFKIKYTKLT